MGARGAQRVVISLLAVVFCCTAAADEKLSELQAKFDSETNAVHKAKMLQKLGDAQIDEAVRAEKAGNFETVDTIMEKYRDNVRAASDALEKGNPDGEHHPNGYKQLEMHLQKGLRELDEFLLEAPDPLKPPLEIVRKDLVSLDDKLLRSLFPKHHNKQADPAPPAGSPPAGVEEARR